MSRCGCSHELQQTTPHFQKSSIRGESGNTQQLAVGSDNTSDNNTAERNAPGKMTMAVIFQLEMPQPDRKDIRNEMDEIFEAVDADSSNPFLAVSDTESAGTHRNCNHPR